jgi:hypothetical protein
MKPEFSNQESELLKFLLLKEIEETRVEIHHAKNMDFKANLTSRLETLHAILGKLE